MKALKISPLFFVLLVTAWSFPQETDYDNYEYGEEEVEYDTPPEFLVEPQQLKAKEGDSVVIPCQYNKTPYVLLIKKAETETEKEILYFVDNVKVRRDRRFKLKDSQVEISNLKRSDAGTYLCRLESDPPLELNHVLEVEYAPSVTAVTKGENRVTKGGSVKLECQAEGNPPPTIKWSKEEGRMPSGASEEEGLSLTLAEVDRHVEGNYICIAENGIGDPASDVMSVIVEYPPEIITEKDMVQSSDGDAVELVCIVHARPPPKVEWTKDGNQLSHDNHIEEQQNGGHRNSIKITKLTEDDFGEYVCTAENELGSAESTISLSGRPKPPHFTSAPKGAHKNSYTLTWDTESYYPVTEYRLKYRKAKANESTNEPGEWIEMTNEVNGNVQTNGLVHSMNHTLSDLEAATDYTTQVQVKNQYLWGNNSEFSFSTKKEMAEPTTKINGASLSSVNKALVMLLPALLLMTLGNC